MVALTGEVLAEQMMRTYQEEAGKAGRDLQLGEDIALGIGFCIGDSQTEAMEHVRPYHDERYKWFAPFGFVRYTDEQGRAWGTPGAPVGVPKVEDGVKQKAWFCGNSGDFVSFLKELEDKYPGLEDIVLQWPEGMPWPEFKDQLTQFSKEVMPAFAGSQLAAGAGGDSD